MSKYSEQFNMRISPKLLRQLKAEAKKAKLTQAQLVRRLVIRFLDDADLKRNMEAKKAAQE